MKQFIDNHSRSWVVEVNIYSAKQVKDLLHFDLLDLDNGNIFVKLGEDPILCADILYVLCKEQCDKLNITDMEFGKSLAGDAFETAANMLVEEIINFFPKAKSQLMNKMQVKLMNWQKSKLALAETKIDNLTDEQLDQLVQNTLVDTGN